ncbi:MAG: LapA family protein [Proteobacteria bacterium]|nr:LapA family protein [Pseudomonadota bacterium]
MKPKTILMAALLFLFAIFVAQNATVVEVKFLFWSASASRALVLIAVFLVAYAIGWLPGWLQGRRDCREETAEITEKKKEEDEDLAEGKE